MEIPKIEVRFENLQISANVQIGSRALPTLVNYTRDALEVRSFNPFGLLNVILSGIFTICFFKLNSLCVFDCVYSHKNIHPTFTCVCLCLHLYGRKI